MSSVVECSTTLPAVHCISQSRSLSDQLAYLKIWDLLGPSALMRDMVVHARDRPMDRRGIKANRRHLNPARGLVRQCEPRWLGRTHAVVFTPAFEVTPGEYHIRISGPDRLFEWTTTLIDCN